MSASNLSVLNALADNTHKQDKLFPAIFVGHGSPMNAIEDIEFSLKWKELGRSLPKPEAIICISAHWETQGTKVTTMPRPKTIHDFYGFPQKLFDMQYPAEGNPVFAEQTIKTIKSTIATPDLEWGLDHGTWSVLCRMYPKADIPVIQLSLDSKKSPAQHYEIGKELKELRKRHIMIIGSGNIVHNLRMLNMQDKAYDWATEFDAISAKLISEKNHNKLIDYNSIGISAKQAIPTNEHYLPLLYILGMQDNKDNISFFNEKISMGSISMRSLIISN
ncbi:MAG: 4,5-DOPA dioxygenase extradiol [Bacteroidota bacterium]